jgi:hypothetical protein
MKRLLILSVSLGLSLLADEGMWMPQQVPQMAKDLKKMGLKIPATDLADPLAFPLNAIVSLGGCSASFVSDQGLVVTNHHCAYSAIQYNSTPENNLIENGFLAASFDQELPTGPSSRIFVTHELREVTAELRQGLEELSDLEREKTLEQRIVAMENAAQREGFRSRVQSFYEGSAFYLITQMEIRDVRLVYAPSNKVGEYGGDEDNWMWPRHTGDFSFYRAYVAPDGNPADYAVENVPYQPKSWLRLNSEGVGPGDFVMVAGYPGRTYRWQTSGEVEEMLHDVYPTRIAMFSDILAIMGNVAAEDPAAEVKLASAMKSLNNSLKNNQGMVEGLAKSDLIARKKENEGQMRAYAARKGKASGVLEDLETLRLQEREQWQARMLNGFSRFMVPGVAFSIWAYEYAGQRELPELQREMGFQDRDAARMKQGQNQAQKSSVPASQKRLLAYSFKRMAQLADADLPESFRKRFCHLPKEEREAAIDAWVEKSFASTRLTELEFRLSLLEKTRADMEAMGDPLLDYAIDRFKEDFAKRDERRARDGKRMLLRNAYIELLRETMQASGKAIYPDANGSLRLSFGTVQGYQPRDAVSYAAQTTTAGLLEKERGEWPFLSPPRLLDLVRQRQYGSYRDSRRGDLVVNYLANCDITGGNSGSATLDAQGRLVGLAFDGNYEAMASDYAFDRQMTRSIHVDVRYMLWVMDAVDRAGRLLEEMGVKPQFPQEAVQGSP